MITSREPRPSTSGALRRFALIASVSLALAPMPSQGGPTPRPREGAGPGPTLHVLVVADRWDAQVKEDVEINLGSIEGFFRPNVEESQLRMTTLPREDFTRAGVLRRVQGLPVGPDDAVAVFVMAHGAYDPATGPYLDLPGGEPLRVGDLRAAIRAKGNRLGLLFLDACQAVKPIPPPTIPAPAAATPLIPKYMIRSLFFEPRGFVELHAAKPGELALCYPPYEFTDPKTRVISYNHRGSLFTQAVIGSLWENLYERHMNWETMAQLIEGRVRREFRDEWPRGFRRPPTAFSRIPIVQLTQSLQVPLSLPRWVAFSDRVGLCVEEAPNQGGVRVTRVYPGSPAARLAVPFVPGDTIASFGGARVDNPAGFAHASDNAGRVAQIRGRQARDGRPYAISLTLAGGPPPAAPDAHDGPAPPAAPPVFFGVSLVPIPQGGLRVVQLVPGTTAAAYNYVVGTLIRSIDGRPMRSRDDFTRALRVAGETVRIRGVNTAGQPFDELVSLRERLGIFWANQGGERPGVRVVSLWGGFPAIRAGLVANDLITKVDGRPVADGDAMERIVKSGGDRVSLEVVRAGTGETETVEVVLGAG